MSRCYVLNKGNVTSDPTAFKIPQVPSSVLAVLGLYSRSFGILNAVESSVALSNYYVIVITRAEDIMVDNKSESEDYFRHNIRGNMFYFLPTDFNASALYDSYNASKCIPRPFICSVKYDSYIPDSYGGRCTR